MYTIEHRDVDIECYCIVYELYILRSNQNNENIKYDVCERMCHQIRKNPTKNRLFDDGYRAMRYFTTSTKLDSPISLNMLMTPYRQSTLMTY